MHRRKVASSKDIFNANDKYMHYMDSTLFIFHCGFTTIISTAASVVGAWCGGTQMGPEPAKMKAKKKNELKNIIVSY